MALKIYNLLSGRLERFRPIDREHVSMYVCGPAVYDHAHLGHAKTYVTLDVVSRYLNFRGYDVHCVRGLTDVGHMTQREEGCLSSASRRLGIMPMELTDTYIWSFHDDMDALGVLRPNITPRASCYVSRTIAWIGDLIELGYAYEAAGSVYFSVDQFADYGKLSRQLVELQGPKGGLDPGQDQRNPADFVLWRSLESGASLCWPSPWGQGCPGSHIASSVMADACLGKTFDIHAGGMEDFVSHNDCELAQTEAHNGMPAAKYWLPVGDLLAAGERMSRSLGNHLTIKDALKLYSPAALRYFLLSTHYREPADFHRDALLTAERQVAHLHETVRHLRRRIREALPSLGAGTAAFSTFASLPDYREDFRDALDNDFDTSRALTVIAALCEEVRHALMADREASPGTLSTMDKLFRDLAGGVLGILTETVALPAEGKLIERLVETLLELRADHLAARRWGQADVIRSRLDEIGVIIQDGPHDTFWRLKGS